jgi:hypothetical protein
VHAGLTLRFSQTLVCRLQRNLPAPETKTA